MLATATGNCDVTNQNYNPHKYMSSRELSISSPRCTCPNASDYVRSLLCATFACWFRSGVALTFDEFYHSSFF